MQTARWMIAGACVLSCMGIYRVGLTRAADPPPSSAPVGRPAATVDQFESPSRTIYRLSETERQEQIARQLNLTEQMQWAAPYWLGRSPRPVQQPIGHESVQVGPNRWVYRPIYAPRTAEAQQPGESPQPRATRPSVARPLPTAPRVVELPAPSDPEPPDFVPPPGAVVRPLAPPPRPLAGPRAF